MYGLPEDFDASVFLGRELIQICFSANTIDFAFSGDILVTLESSFIYSNSPTDEGHRQTIPVSSSNLMGLIGATVDSVTSQRDGTLFMSFNNEHRLTFLDDSTSYESYCIHIGDRLVIV
jgi:hypothetical protein